MTFKFQILIWWLYGGKLQAAIKSKKNNNNSIYKLPSLPLLSDFVQVNLSESHLKNGDNAYKYLLRVA